MARKPAQADASASFAEWAELAGLRRALADAAIARERARLEAAERAAQAMADADLFRRTVGKVAPMTAPERVMPFAPRPLPLPLKTRENEREVMREALSDAYDPDVLVDIDDSLSFKRHGVGQEVVRKLRRGHWVVQAQIDLHGYRTDEARDAMALFLRDAAKRGLRCVRVIHGKGLGSVNREPVLKGRVRSWLTQKNEVMAFVEARERDGGAGALLVLLQTQRQCL
ncbi:DNA mismatch repair protein MutS [Robbsia andropogonis]|uniref:DNA mismatch repair protein MutS n=2 Tax=Robbsia andropogonis TaxID=28092 RepID=A0A0F5JU59_9BURK|nr:Smr/MutS family protein [Robbsia andropogonis]KKB61381.1 DNA mismatch repair protein MutS [Robbsia andropogonis]